MLVTSASVLADSVQFTIRVQRDVEDISALEVKTFDLISGGLFPETELETEMREKIQARIESTGLVYDPSKKDLFVGVIFVGFSDHGNELPGMEDWPSQTYGSVDSAFALLAAESEKTEGQGAWRSIQIHILAPPTQEVPVRIWTGSVTYNGLETDTDKLANVMLEQLLLEYPVPSGKPELREVILSE